MTRQLLPSTGSLGRLSPFLRYHELLRLLAAPPAPPQLSLGSAVPRFITGETASSPRFLGNPSRYAAFSDPGRTELRLAFEDDQARGESLFPATFVRGLRRCRCLIPRLGRWLAASRRFGSVPASSVTTRTPAIRTLSGLHHAALRSLSTLRGFPLPAGIVRPRKTRFRLVASLCRVGLLSPPGC